jgi:CubicO group peptidase (beta-lactamase class C family)
MTHTSGFGYDTWNANLFRYTKKTNLPAVRTAKLAALDAPLLFDPGERWQYGIGIEWTGRMIETVTGESLAEYFRDHIFAPLGMGDTGYDLRADQLERLASTHKREAGGALTALEYVAPAPREFFPGGGGLYSTARDYLTLLRMLLNGGSLNGQILLRPETVHLMAQNHTGEIDAGVLVSMRPELSEDVESFPGIPKRWGLSFLINTKDVPGGRAAGSLAWAGLLNTHFWLDPKNKIAAVFMTQVLPFGDKTTMRVLDNFERAVYGAA